MSRLVTIVLAVVGSLALAVPSLARDRDTRQPEPPAPVAVKDSDAKKLVKVCEKALAVATKEDVVADRRRAELAALTELAQAQSRYVARRLIQAGMDEDLDSEARCFALRALPLQGKVATKEIKLLDKWLRQEADDDADDLKRGRIGLPIDRNGDPVTDTPEAKRALREGERRARVVATGIVALRGVGHVPKRAEDLLEPFLQSPYDPLAIAAVEAAAEWGARNLADKMCLLLRMYPRDNRWETGAVTHLGGTNASAKAAWMALFGHPLKRRARPALHRAVVACVSEWAGMPFPDPESCEAWLASRQ